MKRTAVMSMFCLIAICSAICSAESVIVATTYVDSSGVKVTENGTAVAIHSNERGTILLTCKHVVEHAPESVWISYDGGDWVQCSHVLQHPSEDIATMECQIRVPSRPMINNATIGAEVVVDGAGPKLHGSGEPWYFKGLATEDGIVSEEGLAVIRGDSGGPVYCRSSSGVYSVAGIAHSCLGNVPGLRRADHRGRAITLYTPCSAFYPWIQTQYCPQGNCPIQIRPQLIQPVGPLGFPRGPARVIRIAEPISQRYEPVPPAIRPTPDPISTAGPRGPAGPPGPPGHDGRSVQQAEVESVVNSWLDSNIERIRGPQGDPGKDGSAADVSGLESRLTTIEKRKFRMVISSGGQIVDDEEFMPGEPVVLDLRRIRNMK